MGFSRNLVRLGAKIYMHLAKVFLPVEKHQKTVSRTAVLLIHLVAVQGFLISTIDLVLWVQFHSRALQRSLLPFERDISRCRHEQIKVSENLQKELKLWTVHKSLTKRISFIQLHQVVVTTDVIKRGWGAHYMGMVT